MRTITKRLVGRHLAATEVLGFRFFCGHSHGCKFTARVRAVTERLAFAFATGAPVIGLAGFNFYSVGGFLCDGRLHADLLKFEQQNKSFNTLSFNTQSITTKQIPRVDLGLDVT